MNSNQILKTSEDDDPQREQYTLLLTPDSKTISQRRHTKKPAKENHAWFYLGLVGNIGYTIALPIAGGAILGSFVDGKLATYPKFTLSLLLLGTVISIIGFIQTIRDIIKEKH